jgi:hypothetical protein
MKTDHITIATTIAGLTVTIVREGDGWRVTDRGGDEGARRYNGPFARTRRAAEAAARRHFAYLAKREAHIATRAAA